MGNNIQGNCKTNPIYLGKLSGRGSNNCYNKDISYNYCVSNICNMNNENKDKDQNAGLLENPWIVTPEKLGLSSDVTSTWFLFETLGEGYKEQQEAIITDDYKNEVKTNLYFNYNYNIRAIPIYDTIHSEFNTIKNQELSINNIGDKALDLSLDLEMKLWKCLNNDEES